MAKNNKKKKVKSNKKVNKVATPVEEIKDEELENTESLKDAEDNNKEEDKKAEKSTNKKDKSNKKSEKKDSNKKHWFKDFKAELKKIIWPTKKELINNTVVVILVVTVVSVLVLIFDLIFSGLTKLEVDVLEKVKGDENIVNEVVENTTEENATEEDNTVDSESTEGTENSTETSDDAQTENIN